MLKQLKQSLRDIGVWFFRLIGSEIRDCRTGKPLGRGLIFYWGGRVHLLGCNCAVVPLPLPQPRVTYWKQSIGFTAHPEVDFPRRAPHVSSPSAQDLTKVLLVLLDHREPASVEKTISLWEKAGFEKERILLAYGGGPEAFEKIAHDKKFLLNELRHRTSDHQREKQSYREIFTRVSDWLTATSFTHVLFHEYDHVPLVPDLATHLARCMAEEQADVLAYHLGRVDASTNAHWLAMLSDTYDQPVALSMIGTGHFWTREAWVAVSHDHSLADSYLELDLPTTAHRLGYRLREIRSQSGFVSNLEKKCLAPEAAVAAGAWTLHPVKDSQIFAIVEQHIKMQSSASTRE
jgi:hypothetical protein